MSKTNRIQGIPACRGMALIEALVSFLVMAIGLVALLSFHTESQRNIAVAKSQAEAVALAEQKLQELESFLVATDTRLTVGSFSDPDNPISGTGADFNRSWNISQIDASCTDSPGAYCARDIDVTVTWGTRHYDADGIEETESVILSSEVYVREPTEAIQNLLMVVADAASSGSGSNQWPDGGGNQEVPTDDGQQDDGADPSDGSSDGTQDGESEQATIYRIQFVGEADIQGEVRAGVAVALTGISFLNTDYSVSCDTSFPISGGFYHCESEAIPIGASWSGVIEFQSNGEVCLPEGGSLPLSGITSDQVVNVTIRKNSGQCP